jgi:hypothetical protein
MKGYNKKRNWHSNRHNKYLNKGQVFTLDFIVGLSLFLITIFAATKVLFSMTDNSAQVAAYRDAMHISEQVLAAGYPSNWTHDNVLSPGIAENNRVNPLALQEYSQIDYQHSKTLLHITSEYAFYIKNSTGIINTTKCIYGYSMLSEDNCTLALDNMMDGISYDNLVRVERIVIYDSRPVRLVVYAWNKN